MIDKLEMAHSQVFPLSTFDFLWYQNGMVGGPGNEAGCDKKKKLIEFPKLLQKLYKVLHKSGLLIEDNH